MRVLALCVVACSSQSPAPAPPVPAPAPPPAPAPVTPAVNAHCAFEGAMERIALEDGHLVRSSGGVNHSRDIEFKVAPDAAGELDLVFVAYGPRDYPPVMNWHGPEQPREKLVPGKSIVAHIGLAGGESRLYEREVDLHTGMRYQTRDHSYPCALIDGDYLAKHPDEFLK